MALKLNLVNSDIPGIIRCTLKLEGVSDIYIRIDKYLGEGNSCLISLGFYSLIEQVVPGEIQAIEPVITKLNFPTIEIRFIVSEDSSENDTNVRKQGYQFLKTLPEFLDCEDC